MKENLPLLSVIVPIYGVEEYLEECVSSIIRQTYSNLEIILVDDGSKGKEPQICDKFATCDKRVKVIHKKNEGLVEARKTGVETAVANYITFVDGDDHIDIQLYEKMMKWIIAENPDILITGFIQEESDKRIKCCQRVPSGIYQNDKISYIWHNMNCYNKLYYENGIFPSTCLKIYKKEMLEAAIRTIPKEIRMGEDSAVTFPYLLKCKKIIVDNSICGYYYRTVNNSMSRSTDESLFSRSGILYEYLKPFYEITKDIDIIDQLEIYRIYLMDAALSNWMSKRKLWEIPAVSRKLKKIVMGTSLFDNITFDLNIAISKDSKVLLRLITESKWRTFELKWMEKLLLSYLHTMARGILKKA